MRTLTKEAVHMQKWEDAKDEIERLLKVRNIASPISDVIAKNLIENFTNSTLNNILTQTFTINNQNITFLSSKNWNELVLDLVQVNGALSFGCYFDNDMSEIYCLTDGNYYEITNFYWGYRQDFYSGLKIPMDNYVENQTGGAKNYNTLTIKIPRSDFDTLVSNAPHTILLSSGIIKIVAISENVDKKYFAQYTVVMEGFSQAGVKVGSSYEDFGMIP